MVPPAGPQLVPVLEANAGFPRGPRPARTTSSRLLQRSAAPPPRRQMGRSPTGRAAPAINRQTGKGHVLFGRQPARTQPGPVRRSGKAQRRRAESLSTRRGHGRERGGHGRDLFGSRERSRAVQRLVGRSRSGGLALPAHHHKAAADCDRHHEEKKKEHRCLLVGVERVTCSSAGSDSGCPGTPEPLRRPSGRRRISLRAGCC